MIWIIIGIFMVIFCVHRLYFWCLPKLAEYYLKLTGSYVGAVDTIDHFETNRLQSHRSSIWIITSCFSIEYDPMNRGKFLSFLNKKGKKIEKIRLKLEHNKKVFSDDTWKDIVLYTKAFEAAKSTLF